ncbi:MAG: aromatic ring-hydroxylating dioxygenase subunit alpha [Myxococcales bacterium]|nr:aromatic ring-hydroxylating dioxygenase subunit alpha [Myxococcota bacterium]MDW8280356.1 aromatic ring-hydroxylating dioxygenase subunit alpha [Myxococcales bacterium]
MDKELSALVRSYDPHIPLERAVTLPAPFYLDGRVLKLEQRTVFFRSWQVVGRTAQVAVPGCYLTAEVAGEPVLVVRGHDGVLRAFYNVCRHHAAAVMTEPEGRTDWLRCPYHGWTYALSGELRGTPDFQGACDFDRDAHGLLPIAVACWQGWVLVRLAPEGPSLQDYLGEELSQQIAALDLSRLSFFCRRRYEVPCNWKVFIDNYLDGGYHVPHLHRGLASVLDNARYAIELGDRFCLQWSPLSTEHAEAETAAVRTGERALYYWIYPNFMINWYEGAMDTNLVVPRGVDRTEVIFDYYFADTSPAAEPRNLASIGVSERIQQEDVAVCQSVQRGLASRSYLAGRLSPRREAGEHLFHRLLHADLISAFI